MSILKRLHPAWPGHGPIAERRALGMDCMALFLAAFVAATALVGAASASAAAAAPGWAIDSFAKPSSFSASHNVKCAEELTNPAGSEYRCDSYTVTATNTGSQPTDGSSVTLVDTVPAGVTVQQVRFFWEGRKSIEAGFRGQDLSGVLCEPVSSLPLRCHSPIPLAPDEELRMVVYVTLDPGAGGGLTNVASVSGGGASGSATSVRNPVDSTSPVGFSAFSALFSGLDGAPDTQAASHPYELAMRFDLNNELRLTPQDDHTYTSIHDVKDVAVDLPLGMVGSALAAPTCPLTQLSARQHCPSDTVVGELTTEPAGSESVEGPLYNMVPERGVAAEFGFVDGVKGAHVLYVRVVPTRAGYVLRTTSPDIPQVDLTDIIVTLYGDPAGKQEEIARQEGKQASSIPPVALFTNPSDCSGGSLVTAVHADSWQNPGRFNADGLLDLGDPSWVSTASASPQVTGCDRLRFNPSLSVQPETSMADSATGLQFGLKVPQPVQPGTLATPPLRNAAVMLPAGLTVNPSAASGLGACSESQIGWLGGSLSNFTAAAPACPESSKLGTVEVSTPALAGTLTGSIYLATQDENPFHSLLAGYIVINDPATGVVVKIPGELKTDPNTGQITGVFDENPQLPFSDLELHFFGGPHGELATPEGCGTYTTTSDLAPWSAPDSGPDATPSDSFPITSGCVAGFAPAFTAGSSNPLAGVYSPFDLSLSRTDGEQGLAGLSVTLPPGLLGKVAGIPLCPDANANAGTCPAASQIGRVQVGAGAGPNPLFVSGKAYLTGPYNGGPYGLVVQVPAVAGPFDLGMVSVRQSLRIDPHTAQVTAVSDPFPRILDGVPLRVRRVDVTLDRPGFTFNPTNCTPMAVTGTVVSTAGASSRVSSRLQVGGCRELPFKPSFRVSTQARTSKKNGASLDVRVGYPQGAQANIARVAVNLPKQLPSRLTTIQQACTEASFNANPASCPAGSNIGIATARTPVLANPLVGPAYLVSHGGAAFPDLVLILQGEGVTLDLVGSINIKKQITSSTFASVPDAPISSFELSLPEGPHSGLAAVVPAKAKGNLCGQSLVMPTTMTGQNGAVLKQNTKITISGCPKAKKKHKTKHKKVKKK